jgi:hypothetical protein
LLKGTTNKQGLELELMLASSYITVYLNLGFRASGIFSKYAENLIQQLLDAHIAGKALGGSLLKLSLPSVHCCVICLFPRNLRRWRFDGVWPG